MIHVHVHFTCTCTQVSALGLDPAGARLITGCYGYDVKLWDFGGMDAKLNCFRTLTPCGRYFITLYC